MAQGAAEKIERVEQVAQFLVSWAPILITSISHDTKSHFTPRLRERQAERNKHVQVFNFTLS